MADEVPEYQQKAYLSREDEEKMVNRLYAQSLDAKKQKMDALDARYYPKTESKKITKEQMQKSVNRQVDEEMERRKQANAEADQRAYSQDAKTKNATVKTLTKEEIDSSVRRMYDETLEKKQRNMEESRKQYMFDPEKTAPTKKAPPAELKEYFERISKPKKTEYSTAEINKVYGLGETAAAPPK